MEREEIIFEGEVFNKYTLNKNVIIVDGKGFFNANRICSNTDTSFSYITRTSCWYDCIDKISEKFKCKEKDIIIKRNNLPFELRGTYIHRKLVNKLCLQIDYKNKFGIEIDKFLDLIDADNRNRIEKLSDDKFIYKLIILLLIILAFKSK